MPLAWALAILAQRHSWGAVLEGRGAKYLGAISYPLYLVNEPVQRGLALALAQRRMATAPYSLPSFYPVPCWCPWPLRRHCITASNCGSCGNATNFQRASLLSQIKDER